MNVFLRALMVIIPLLVAIFVLTARLHSEQEEGKDEEEANLGDWKQQIVSSQRFWILAIPVVIVAFVLLIGGLKMIEDNNRLKNDQEARKFREKLIDRVYELKNGEKIPNELVRYSAKRQVYSIMPGGAQGEEIIDLDIDPGDEVFLRGEIAGDSWELNCAQLPIGRLRSYTSGGTSHGNDRLIQFEKDGTFSVRTQLVHGGRPGLTVGCPGYLEWIKLDYKIVEKRRVS